ncbi:MAG: glycosyltransferase family 9 protein [Gammaproteobacteria bacterium]|nr:glycosyltransferase family 9 protein [Gammaproteobacteria bacterium]
MRLWFGNGAWASQKAHQKVHDLTPEKIKNVAVIRHAALGDMVLTRPFLRELRKCFPNSHITLSVVTNYMRGIPEDLVDTVHVAYGKDKKKVSKREQIRKAKELGKQDIIFDLAATHRSFYLCLLNRSTLRVGFPYHRMQRKLFYDVAVFRSDFIFETDCMFNMLNIFGFVTSYPPPFDLPGDVRKEQKPYVVYFTSASTPLRCWPMENFSELVDNASEKFPEFNHYVLKGIGDWESINDILKNNEHNKNVSGLNIDSLDETIALIKGASLVISNDTGIRHLAIAAGVPSVGIFFTAPKNTSMPFRYWPRFGPHSIVVNYDGSIPESHSVFEAVKKSLQPR